MAGATYYVSATGSDSNDGLTSGSPFLSVWKAIQTLNANSGATAGRIFVAAGTYQKAWTPSAGNAVNIPTKPVALIATGGRAVMATYDGWTWGAFGCVTTVTTGATSATQTVGSTTGMVAGQSVRIGNAWHTVSSVTNSTTVVLTASTTTTTGEAVVAGYPGVFRTSTTVSANTVARVLDRLNLDRFGLYTDLAKVATVEECAVTPGTWCHPADNYLYVHRADGQAPTNNTTRVLRVVPNLVQSGSTQYSMFLLGSTDADGFDFEGGAISGGTGGCVQVSYTAGAGGKVFYSKNCTFRYAGTYNTADGSNGVSITSLAGLVMFDGCDFSGNRTDGVNVHDNYELDTHLLTINCTGFRNGMAPSVSCNGWTTHEAVVGIDIGGNYQVSSGCVFHAIDTTRTYAIGTVVGWSRGDRAQGGAFDPCAFRVSNSAVMWCYGTRAVGLPSDRAYQASDTAAIHLRDIVEVGGGVQAVGGSGTIDDYLSTPAPWALTAPPLSWAYWINPWEQSTGN
jgi:hypothetical protein